MSKSSIIERVGIRFVQRQKAVVARGADDVVHILNPIERAVIRAIEVRAIVVSACIGMGAAAVSVLGTQWISPNMNNEQLSWMDVMRQFPFATLGSGLLVVSVAMAEIILLYRVTLRAVHRMAIEAGIKLNSANAESNDVIASLVHAAMDMPISRQSFMGIDPMRHASRWKVLLVSWLYLGKVFVTTFILKVILRRLLTRVVVREWLQLVAVPVSGFWNAWVCWRVLREARLRIFGRSAVAELLQSMSQARAAEPKLNEIMIRCVACVIVTKARMHSTLRFMLMELSGAHGMPELERIDDQRQLLFAIGHLDLQARSAAFQVLRLAAVVDGRCNKRLLKLVASVEKLGGGVGGAEDRPLEMVRLDFCQGRGISAHTG